MKKILLVSSVLFLIGCGNNDKDCSCTQQKYQRTAVYTTPSSSNPTSTLVSASEWEKTGNPESANTDDCGQNGSVKSGGNTNVTPIPGTTNYSTTEYEFRITCQ